MQHLVLKPLALESIFEGLFRNMFLANFRLPKKI